MERGAGDAVGEEGKLIRAEARTTNNSEAGPDRWLHFKLERSRCQTLGFRLSLGQRIAEGASHPDV
jgi:hypothetical protein